MAKETKTTSVEFRLTPEEKERIKAHCKQYGMTMSEFIRWICLKEISKEN